MGGAEVIRKKSEEHKKDWGYLQKNVGEWYQKYPDHWVVIYNEELIAVTNNVVVLIGILEEKSKEGKKVLTWFLNTEPMILQKQEVCCGT